MSLIILSVIQGFENLLCDDGVGGKYLLNSVVITSRKLLKSVSIVFVNYGKDFPLIEETNRKVLNSLFKHREYLTGISSL